VTEDGDLPDPEVLEQRRGVGSQELEAVVVTSGMGVSFWSGFGDWTPASVSPGA
jgi:hypothetical protein